jgi:hypothetical protein
MKRIRSVLLIGAIWQVLRFVLIFMGLAALYNGMIMDKAGGIYWFLLYSAGSLVIPAGLIIISMGLANAASLLKLVILGKALELFPSVIILGMELSRRSVLSQTSPLISGVALVAGFDLIFLIIFISYRER